MTSKEKTRKKTILITTHILIWTVLLGLPYLLAAGESFNALRVLRRSTIPLIFYAIIFYTNYFVLIDKLWLKKDKVYFVLVNALLIAAFITLNHKLRPLLIDATSSPDLPKPFNLLVYIEVMSMLLPIAFSIALKAYEKWVQSEEANKQARSEKIESELQHLKYQLQPHFFFNSLNNIYALIDLHPERAKETVHSLAKLMRYLLYDTNATTVSLAKEIDFMKKYIKLMELRTADHIKVTVDFPTVDASIMVAPLLFISLIENAFKHGVSAKEFGQIEFKMMLDNEWITFSAQNPNLPKLENDKSGSGIGLENLKRRLSIIYPKSHKLKVETDSQWYRTELAITIKNTRHE